MVNEFSVRAEVARIDSLDASPIRKARMFLHVARRLRPAALKLSMLSEHHYRTGDPLRGARFQEATRRIEGLQHDARSCAAEAFVNAKRGEGSLYAVPGVPLAPSALEPLPETFH